MLWSGNRIRQGSVRGAIALLIAASVAGCPSEPREPPSPWPSAAVEDPLHEFGEIVEGTRIEHRFSLRNRGLEDLVLEEREVAASLTLGEFQKVVPPGESVEIPVVFDSSGLSGSGELRVLLGTNDPDTPDLSLGLNGRVLRLVEVAPRDRIYFLDLVHGASATSEVRVVNHQQEPLKVLSVAPGEPRYFQTDLETVREGQEYLLRVRTDLPDAAGTFEETLSISTDSTAYPTLPVYVVARVLETVHAEPAVVAFSRFYLDELDSEFLSTKKVRVQKAGASDFRIVKVDSDVSELEFDIEVEHAGESYLVIARIDPERADRGPLDGTLWIHTNDPEFPRLELPVSGEIL